MTRNFSIFVQRTVLISKINDHFFELLYSLPVRYFTNKRIIFIFINYLRQYFPTPVSFYWRLNNHYSMTFFNLIILTEQNINQISPKLRVKIKVVHYWICLESVKKKKAKKKVHAHGSNKTSKSFFQFVRQIDWLTKKKRARYLTKRGFRLFFFYDRAYATIWRPSIDVRARIKKARSFVRLGFIINSSGLVAKKGKKRFFFNALPRGSFLPESMYPSFDFRYIVNVYKTLISKTFNGVCMRASFN